MTKKYNLLYHSHYPWSDIMSRYTNLAISLSKSTFVNRLVFLDPLQHIGNVDKRKILQKIALIGKYHKIADRPLPIYSAINPVPFRRYKIFKKATNLWSKHIINKVESLIPPDNRILLLQGPSEYTLRMLKALKKRGFLTIFDWANLYEEHVGSDKRGVASLCREIASIADIVLCVSPQISGLALSVNKNTFLHPNAIHDDMITKNVSPPKSLGDRMKSAVVCYFGLINPIKIDCSLINEIAKKKKDWKFILIGPQSDPTNIGIRFDSNNISVLPPMDGYSLHDFLRKNADLTFIPYNLQDKAVYACSPLKLYEAFGLGLSVVSTDTFDPLDAKDMVRVSNSTSDLIAAMEHELESDSLEKREARIKYAKKNTWDTRVNQLIEIIENTINNRKDS